MKLTTFCMYWSIAVFRLLKRKERTIGQYATCILRAGLIEHDKYTQHSTLTFLRNPS